MAHIDCICPSKADGQMRHPDGDEITLRETLGFRSVLALRNEPMVLKTEDPDASTGEILAALTEGYLVFGVESWTLVDAKGKPIPVTRANVREHLLSRPDAAIVVADAADERYSAVVLPLLLRASNSSPLTPTSDSTSPTNGGSTKRPKRSSPSSTTSSPTAGTATTTSLLAGGSNS